MDQTPLDQALETALTDKDFGSVRAILREQGYALAKDESEPDLAKALQLSRTEDDDEGTFVLVLEKEIRSRQAQTLRHILFMTGHKIARPDSNMLTAEEEVRRAAGYPVYVPQNTLEF